MAKPWWPLEICGSISWFCPFGVAVSCLPWACQSMMMKIVVLKKFHWPPLSALQHLIWSLCWKETNTVVESCQTYRKKKHCLISHRGIWYAPNNVFINYGIIRSIINYSAPAFFACPACFCKVFWPTCHDCECSANECRLKNGLGNRSTLINNSLPLQTVILFHFGINNVQKITKVWKHTS